MRAIVRSAHPGDAPTLACFRYDFRCEHRPSAEEEEAFLARCEVWMADRLEGDARWHCWVAEADGEIVGNLWLYRVEKLPNPVAEPEQHAYVTNVYVVPERAQPFVLRPLRVRRARRPLRAAAGRWLSARTALSRQPRATLIPWSTRHVEPDHHHR